MEEVSEKINSNKISFHFHPLDFESKLHAVTKEEGGSKRKYLMGVSSGIREDLHGEKMTERCIKSFQDQANSGDILLFEGQHGVNFVDDIGKLVHSEVTPQGDWLTEYRLYDEQDGFDPASSTLHKVDKLWKQVNGLPPYTKPRQKGFSIEGEVPDGGIVQMDATGKRVMDNVILDGVVVVPRPAYKDSIASAVFKTLGEIPTDVAVNVRKELKERLGEKIRQSQVADNFFHQKFLIDNELEQTIEDIILKDVHGASRERLEILFSEYSSLMIDLILQNEGLFQMEISAESTDDVYRDSGRMKVLKQLESAMLYFIKTRGGVKNGKES